MTTSEPFDADDPFALHFHREPLGPVGIDLLVLRDFAAVNPDPSAWEAGVDWLRAEGRTVEVVTEVVDGAEPQIGEQIRRFLDASAQPIVAICRAERPPSREHWEPLLKGLDQADHVVGGRSANPPAAAWRALARIVRRIVLGVPVADVHSTMRLHRAEKLREIPLQSGSSFVDVEILAKATFLGHVLDEPTIPALPGPTWTRGRLRDLALVFKRPTFRRPPELGPDSRPFEQSQG
ncbi:hypothetical protein [Paludisphaera soli]|uniref:hypothetical protein n=1 Tax=Paludisphaera soli TaxID=2712865 RepID=UPI0013EA64CE|nr:hypothetical protein [Paludisphaera soli]